jgi:hypothetical protein
LRGHIMKCLLCIFIFILYRYLIMCSILHD